MRFWWLPARMLNLAYKAVIAPEPEATRWYVLSAFQLYTHLINYRKTTPSNQISNIL